MLKDTYYLLKPFIPRWVQISVRRRIITRKRSACGGCWPIDERAGRAPAGWSGWPEGKRFALVLTHDVETKKGQDKCRPLADLEMQYGFRSSFNFVPEGYPVKSGPRRYLLENGFEIGVHGLNHKGNLFRSKRDFKRQVPRINHYLKEWDACGFRAPSMYHNLEWIHDLDIEYDASTFDTDPFEPQPDGVGIIFPFFVQEDPSQKGYVELPYTLPQDFTLFILMQERNIDIWKNKLAWIAENGGMALLNTHPDYMSFNQINDSRKESYPVEYYMEFVQFVKEKYHDEYWSALPSQVASFYKDLVLKRNSEKK
jgi:hypothetical protein